MSKLLVITSRDDADEIPSPCIGVCKLDPQTQLCIGCYRTIKEIAGWREYSAEQKSIVLQELPERQCRYRFDVIQNNTQ